MNAVVVGPRPEVQRDVGQRTPGNFADGADIVRAVDSVDSVLMARLVVGDEEALAELWLRHGPLVFGQARKLTGSTALAEDIAQEVFVSLWSHPERFDAERGSLRSYLAVHARRRAIDLLRQDSRRNSREKRHHALYERRDADPEGTEAVGERAELSGTIKAAIDRLPREQREAVRLAYFGGLTHCEVATSLGIPEGTAKSRLRLAQTKLRAWLGPVLQEVV